MGELGERKPAINLLLLGETGTGKSTFVNSFGNYILYSTLEESEKSKLICKISSSFMITDEDYEEQEVSISSNDEFYNIEGPREFTFKYEDFSNTVCLVDTPGVGTVEGLENDELNIRSIIDYMQRFEYINAICFFLKPNITILTDYFRFCITHLLSCIDNMATPNIVFIFTHTRSSSFRPGDTFWVLKRLLEELEQKNPHITVPLNKTNVFCFDNEGFRYRAASEKGFKFDEQEKECFERSWKVSADNCRNLMKYIIGDGQTPGLKPYKIIPKSVTFAPKVLSPAEDRDMDFHMAAVKFNHESQTNISDNKKDINQHCQPLFSERSIVLQEENSLQKHKLGIGENFQNVKVPSTCDSEDINVNTHQKKIKKITSKSELFETGSVSLSPDQSYQESVDSNLKQMQNTKQGKIKSNKSHIICIQENDTFSHSQEGNIKKNISRFLQKCSLM